MPRASIERLAALLSFGLLLSLLLPWAATARDDVPDEIARLENPVTLEPERVAYFAKQFKAKCARCHGKAGDGGGGDAKDQEVPPTDFTDAAHMSARTDGRLYYQILMGGGDRCAMPAFGPGSDHGWSEEKVWEMVAFVRRFAPPKTE
jgi:mono/diheme cytochrome c family protein